jgi:hypothetical protein
VSRPVNGAIVGHSHGHPGPQMESEEIRRLREKRLVPWAKGKCQNCGDTLCESPLGHECGPMHNRKISGWLEAL